MEDADVLSVFTLNGMPDPVFIYESWNCTPEGCKGCARWGACESLFSGCINLLCAKVMQRQIATERLGKSRNSSRPTQSIFFAGILLARTEWTVTTFSESVRSIQLFVSCE